MSFKVSMHDEIKKKKKRSNVGRYRLDHQATRFALKKGLLTLVLNVSDLQRNFCKSDLSICLLICSTWILLF